MIRKNFDLQIQFKWVIEYKQHSTLQEKLRMENGKTSKNNKKHGKMLIMF